MSDSSEKPSKKLPISEIYKIIDYVTIFKNPKWWKAIVISEAYGRRSIAVYLWVKRIMFGSGKTSSASENSTNGTKSKTPWISSP